MARGKQGVLSFNPHPEFSEETEAENFFVANAEIAEWLGKIKSHLNQVSRALKK